MGPRRWDKQAAQKYSLHRIPQPPRWSILGWLPQETWGMKSRALRAKGDQVIKPRGPPLKSELGGQIPIFDTAKKPR
jgi:hypothetical protein